MIFIKSIMSSIWSIFFSNLTYFLLVSDANSDAETNKKKEEEAGLEKTWIRWIMLLMACCFLLGSYYCFDIPGVIEK